VSSIGRYEVESEIGRGAMGIVHLAHDPRLRRRVAIKTYALPQGLSPEETDEIHERFLREAQAAAGLSHPGIVTIYDVDDDLDRNTPYIAMEYVPGESLRSILEREGTLPLEWVAAMTGVLSEALQAAHDAGIVHRDIKPANVLVRDSDGAAKIADFGVARFDSSTLTRSGTSIGSPAYMSPEQIQGRQVDGRSDFFSLAVILYELLCGARPFHGEEPTALIYSVVHEAPLPITKRAQGLPKSLDAFFYRALAKDPERRFPDGAAFRRAFEEACREDASIDVDATVRMPRRGAAPAGATHEDPSSETVPDGPARPMPTFEGPVGGPSRKRVVLAIAAGLFLVWAGWLIFGGKPAHLRLEAKSGIESGELRLLVDGDEVYRRQLSAPRDGEGFFKNVKKILDQDLETFEVSIDVPPGRHEVAAHVLPTGMTSGYQDAIVVDFEPGKTRRIKLAAGRRRGSTLSLKSD
jgi:serine/threonine-protein kinase